MLAPRELPNLGRLLGNEGFEGVKLTPELDEGPLQPVSFPDGLDAPVKEFDGGFRLVALAQFQRAEGFL